VLGGTNASLGTLLTVGLPVPPGFAVSADCSHKALADGGLAGQPAALVAAADPRDPASVAAAGARARALIGSLAVTAGLADAIPLSVRAAVLAVRGRRGAGDYLDGLRRNSGRGLGLGAVQSVSPVSLACAEVSYADRSPRSRRWACSATAVRARPSPRQGGIASAGNSGAIRPVVID